MAKKARILVVEDEINIVKILKRRLESQKYEVMIAPDGETALQVIDQNKPDLVLLDLGLPDVSGLEVCKRVRSQSQLPPIIVISVKSKEQEKIRALDLGADDYIAKPFGIDEVLARVRVALRHATLISSSASTVTFSIGPLFVDTTQRRVLFENREIKLTPTEYNLLLIFLRNQGKILTQQMLLEHVWGNDDSSQKGYLHVYLAHLRRKLEPDPAKPRFFQTISGVGYRFQDQENYLEE